MELSTVKNLFFQAGDFKLDIQEWSFPEKGISALKGKSGSGKTTILKLLSGLLPCPKLSWQFKGEDLIKLSPGKRRLGICFQDLRLFKNMKAREQILFAIKARGFSFKELEEDFKKISSFLEMDKFLDQSVESLSGGEKQRLALARALIPRPQFLFLDEPFASLDKEIKDKARKLTFDLIKNYDTPALLISHDEEDLKDISSLFYLEKGRMKKE